MDDPKRADYWRKQAAEARLTAGQALDETVKRTMLRMALTYDRLASARAEMEARPALRLVHANQRGEMLSDSDSWHLKAEEYRAIGESLKYPHARASYENMAMDCERRATHAVTARVDRTPEQCVAMADQCDLFAEQFVSAAAKRTIGRMADQWRALAARKRNDRPQRT